MPEAGHEPFAYRLRLDIGGLQATVADPYSFGPVLGELDIYFACRRWLIGGPGACKDVGAVVASAERAGLAHRVARLAPVIRVKG